MKIEGLINANEVTLNEMSLGVMYLGHLAVAQSLIPVTIQRSKMEDKYDILMVSILDKYADDYRFTNSSEEGYHTIKFSILNLQDAIDEWSNQIDIDTFGEASKLVQDLPNMKLSDIPDNLVWLFEELLYNVDTSNFFIVI